jgi:uncharacterized membrane protein
MLVHYPLALLPMSIGADLLAKATGSEALEDFGRRTMMAGAVTAALSGVAGLVAQEEVNLEGDEAHNMLTTHRNLNIGLIVGSALLALRRRDSKPGAGYIAAGLGSLAGLAYSAYLGGKLVYKHGAGVERANGVLEGTSAELRRGSTREIFRQSGRHLKTGAQHTFEQLQQGEVAPTLRQRPS